MRKLIKTTTLMVICSLLLYWWLCECSYDYYGYTDLDGNVGIANRCEVSGGNLYCRDGDRLFTVREFTKSKGGEK